MPTLTPPRLSRYEIAEIIRKLETQASRGRIVRLLPRTALLCAESLKRSPAMPTRDDVVRIVCSVKRCDQRNSCYACIGKANAILEMIER